MTTSTFPRWVGDATAGFVRDLADLVSPDWNVTVLAPHHQGAPRRERMQSLDVVRFPYFYPESLQRLCYGGGMLPNARASLLAASQVPTLLLAQIAATRRLLTAERFDLVHAHFLVPQGITTAAVLPHPDIPFVVSVHGSDLFALNGVASRLIQRAVVDRATLVTVNSAATADALRARAPRAADKIVTLPMGIDADVFHPPSSDDTRASSQLLFVGRLSAQKGILTLLDSLPSVIARVPDLSLVIAGDGPQKAQLHARVAALGLTNRVTFVGGVARQRVAELCRSSAAFVMPSLSDSSGREGQGLVVIEAMATGCPVVATRSGGLTALLGHDDRGLLAEPGDARTLGSAIVATLEEPEQTRRRAGAARAFVDAHFTWSALRPRVLEIYDEARARARV